MGLPTTTYYLTTARIEVATLSPAFFQNLPEGSGGTLKSFEQVFQGLTHKTQDQFA